MISEFLLNIVFGVVSKFFALLPDFTWDVDTSAFSYFYSILRIAGYMFPWGTVLTIIGIIFAISIFRIVVAFVRTVLDLLPIG